MKKNIVRCALVGAALTLVTASISQAAPAMLSKGHMSIGATASSRTALNFGYNVADMTKLAVAFGFSNTTPGETSPDQKPDSTTDWNLGLGMHRYMSGKATDSFAPFFGGQVAVNGMSGGSDNVSYGTGFGISGLFGVEGFLGNHVSVSAYLGLGYAKNGDTKVKSKGSSEQTYSGAKGFSTATSAVTATLYW